MPKGNIKFNYFIYRKYKGIKTLTLLSLILSSFLFSDSYYVDTTGTDNAFCSQSNPCEHIQTAIDLTMDGDSVIVSEGTYYENILIETAITLQSEDPLNPAVINGSQPNDIDFSSCIIVKTPRGRNTRISATIEDITMTGGKGTVIIEDTNKDGIFDTNNGDLNKKVGGGLIIANANLTSKKNKIKNNGDSSTKEGGAIYAIGTGGGVPDPDPQFPPGPDDDERINDGRSSIVFEETIFSDNDAQIGHTVMVNGWNPDTTQFLDMDFGNSHFDCIFDSDNNELDGVSEYWIKGKDNVTFDFTGGISSEVPAVTEDVWVDPVTGIDEENYTGSETNPFLTIDYALGMIYATEGNPINLYLAGETFSPATETFPIIMLSNINLIGSGEETTILNADGSEDNIRRVITMIGCNGNILERLTITGGFAGGVTDYDSDNYEDDGGGLFLYSSHPRLENVKIVSNTASYSGGGMYLDKSNPTLINVSIKFNMSLYSGGVHITSSDPYFENVVISDNVAHAIAGGVYLYDSNPEIISVIVSRNTAILGAGMYLNYSNPTLSNATIVENIASSEMYPEYVSGGGIFLADSNPILTNVIIWDNMPESIAFADYSFIPSPIITFSDIEGGWEGDGNIDAEPLFTDPENGDYTLQAGSPCIDTGTADLDGDGYDDITDFFGQAPDMGAYESNFESCESGFYDYCGICDGINIQLFECWDGLCVENVAECSTEECTDGYVADCADNDCCPESWIGDGFADCEDQAYGCDLTCYDNDGGDCNTAVCGDGICDNQLGENADTCPNDCQDDGLFCEYEGFLDDCSGDGDCCSESWVGDGFEDCEDQAYGCDLTCYDNDGGDCEAVDACFGVVCDEDPEMICIDGECVYEDEQGDTGGDTGGVCDDCLYDYTNYGSECCDTAWEEYGINCTDLENNYHWDCTGCNCPGGGRVENWKSSSDNSIKNNIDKRKGKIIHGYFSYSDVRNDCPVIGPDVGCDGVCFSGVEYDECDVCDGDGSSCGLTGDLNGDGMVNVLDVVVLVNIVLGGTEPNDAGDLNGDGMLNVLDVVMLVNIILEG